MTDGLRLARDPMPDRSRRLGRCLALGLAGAPLPPPVELVKPPLEVDGGARVMTGVEVRQDADSTRPELRLFLQQARLSTTLQYLRRLELKLSAELADGLDGPPKDGEVRFLRDARLSYRMAPGLRLVAGRFKRPWSRLELIGDGDLPFRRRGATNALITDDLQYGERGLGLGLSARLELDEASGASLSAILTATAPTPERNQLDLHARVQWAVNDNLELGASVAQKAYELEPEGLPARWIGGRGYQLDLLLGGSAWEAVVDAALAEDLRFGNDADAGYAARSDAAGVAGFVDVRVSVSEHTELQPVVFAEWVDRDLDTPGSELLRFTAGCNVLWHEDALRLLPQVELTFPRGELASDEWPRRTAYSLMFSSEI